MDKLDAALTGGLHAQWSVIGSMLIDEACVPLVLSKLRPEDFVDGKCRSTFAAIRGLTREARPVDPVTVLHAMHGGDDYMDWMRKRMEETPTAANVEDYIGIVRRYATLYRLRELADKLTECTDLDDAEPLVRKMASVLSSTDRMPGMTGPERVADFFARMRAEEKPKYLPWGIPTLDRCVYAELGDMILLGGYASSGKTLLSIGMAQAQAKAGYKVGYYSLETSLAKMTDRQLAALAGVPLWKIKTREFTDEEWSRFAQSGNDAASLFPFDVRQAAGSTVDDITADAIGHGYQVIYVDYVQQLRVAGDRGLSEYARVTAISQGLKVFAQSSNVAVVALAQLSRPKTDDKKPVPPSMWSFKDSGQLEQDADAAFLVYPSDFNDNTSNRIFKVGKNKEGPRPKIELQFQGELQRMIELETRPENEMMKQFYAEGKAIQQKNRARAAQDRQIEFRELAGGDEDNPFS